MTYIIAAVVLFVTSAFSYQAGKKEGHENLIPPGATFTLEGDEVLHINPDGSSYITRQPDEWIDTGH